MRSRKLIFAPIFDENDDLEKKFNNLYKEKSGDWNELKANLTEDPDFANEIIAKLEYTHNLAIWSKDNKKIVKAFQEEVGLYTIRDIALTWNKRAIHEKVVEVKAIHGKAKSEKLAADLYASLYLTEPTAFLQRMAVDPHETPFANKVIGGHISKFLENQNGEFNIREESIYKAFGHEEAFEGIEIGIQEMVADQLKTLQRVTAISPTPEALSVLIKTNLTSAYSVSEIPESQFVKKLSKQLGPEGEEVAKRIHRNAVNARIRNEHALMAIKETGLGTGVDFIDKSLNPESYKSIKYDKLVAQAETKESVNNFLTKNHLGWDKLFADVDLCECEHCNSVYSPAAYFVDLLQYLRNNNIDPEKRKENPRDISGTPLEYLFNRRPDLGCLELTCKNTNTVLPYVDLVNEILENYIVYGETKAFNLDEETSGELLAQPQHINYDAYCILHKTEYPFTLPYHQPIDVIRIFLDYLGTSRYELMKKYRRVRPHKIEHMPETNGNGEDNCVEPIEEVDKGELDNFYKEYLRRAIGAEYLGLTQEEYVILTKEAFVTKEYWDKNCNEEHSLEEYRKRIGLKEVHEYYGYNTSDSMLSDDEGQKKGLTFVKDQFLKRTGVEYKKLVELLQTRFLNPNMPEGEALKILNSLGFSYRFLKSLVDNESSNDRAKYAKLVKYLETFQPLIPIVERLLLNDPCKPIGFDFCKEKVDFEKWVHCYFESVGKIIVLENGCSCVNGIIITPQKKSHSVAVNTPVHHGEIIDCIIYIKAELNYMIGSVDRITGEITPVEGYEDAVADLNGTFFLSSHGKIGQFLENRLINFFTKLPFCEDQSDTCNLDTVRLKHLDGSPLKKEEYDRIHRFIRLWRKMGWTIDEIDKAIIGLGKKKEKCLDELLPVGNNDCGELFDEDSECESVDAEIDCYSPEDQVAGCKISPDLINQLVAVNNLLDKTGLEINKLLTFWANISTSGKKSLYKRLFLKHNIQGLDPIFKADKNGQYLMSNAKISDHIPVLMAALNLKADDIRAIMSSTEMEDTLTLENVSILYRYRLLSRIIGERIPEFIKVLKLFGNVFKDSRSTLKFLKRWLKMEESGFDFNQLNYLIRDEDNNKKPLAPSKRFLLELTKTIYDELNKIEDSHQDMGKEEIPDSEYVKAKTSILFDEEVVQKIIGILEGTTIYRTNAPKGLVLEDLDDKNSLKSKFYYNSEEEILQITGILTDAEKATYLTLNNDNGWSQSIKRIEIQQQKLFGEVLKYVFEIRLSKVEDNQEIEEAKNTILSGDIAIPVEEVPDGQDNPNTKIKKQRAFLFVYIPFLRQKLSERVIANLLSEKTGLDQNATEVLIFDVLKLGDPKISIYDTFEKIKYNPTTDEIGWKGYLIPPKTELFTFVVNKSEHKPVITIDDQQLEFTRQDDPTNEWISDSIQLQTGQVYSFVVNELKADLAQLRWKTTITNLTNLPVAALLPNYSSENAEKAYKLLDKVAILINEFEISADEIKYIDGNKTDFDDLDFNQITIKHWLRLQAYTRLRNSLPKTDFNILEFFRWTKNPSEGASLSEKIEELTTWKKERIGVLLAEDHYNINDPSKFRNEKNLLKLKKALEIADKVGMDITVLFNWAIPTSNFNKTRRISESLKKAVKAQFKQDDWEKIVKPLNDKLRRNQGDALTAYLLVQPELIEWGVKDIEGLFEYFLIDVQMDPCMETSRIKQAISSTQLFVQRCFLGLEQPGVPIDRLDRDRWDWMSRYRVWEANRKVFLYPENWIESNLRDDKSPFFKELESELLQNDINQENVTNALKDYLYKVDEVANMEVVGIYIEGNKDTVNESGEQGWIHGSKLHVFSRTRNAPFFFYYRYLALDEMNWYPWEKVQVDIPSYDIEDQDSNIITGNGSYLIPIVWNNRLLIFFPQFARKIKPADNSTRQIGQIAQDHVETSKPTPYWEIKMGWSEYRNGKWTQKKLSKNAIYHIEWRPGNGAPVPSSLMQGDIEKFEFVPTLDTQTTTIGIRTFYNDNELKDGIFEFSGNDLIVPTKTYTQNNSILPNNFHHDAGLIRSLQISSEVENHRFNDLELTTYNGNKFHHPHTMELLGEINKNDLKSLFKYNLSIVEKQDAFGYSTESIYNELKSPYSLYNWELFFHCPMMLAIALSESQRFDEAMKWFHYVFDPTSNANTDVNSRFWTFRPFKELRTNNILNYIFGNLQPNRGNAQISEWREKPFRPHLIARSRPVAYMKWTIMKYIDNLLDWGDYLFRQDTIESLNYATQLYVLALHILGAKPKFIPKRGKIQPRSYLSLLDKWDAFSNANVEMEIIVPYSNQRSLPIGVSNGVVGLSNVFGFGSALYFCLPNNPKLSSLWDKIYDRLFKIRHCLNIEGVFRKLSLFEPPIDPALLVKATAQGLSIASVLNDLYTPMPNYRFYYLLQKALELCNELKSMGNSLLSVLEKRDTESLSLLRAKHESRIQDLIMEIRTQQLEEAKGTLESLKENRKAPVHRMKYYLQLVGEDVNKVPGSDSDFTELANSIEKPTDESGLKLIKYEKQDMDKAKEASDWQTKIGVVETIASTFHALPTFSTAVHPLGVGADVHWGFPHLAHAATATARGLRVHADNLNFQSLSAGKKGGFLRALQDRIMQVNAAGYEVKQIDKQILTQQIRIELANQEIINQQKLIDNAAEVEDFLKNKYTNEELYTWIRGQLKTVYYQVYSLAYELAKKAEKVYRFERGLSSSDFIKAGYWNAGRDGLLAGEQLYVGLKQLEAAFQERKGYDYELTKHVSLRQINPMQLYTLRETGKCEFELPEVLFDMDFPGHYNRRIKSVSISIPCVVGPYTSINASLRLLAHKFRNSSSASSKNNYLEGVEESDPRFVTYNIPIESIAASSAQNDSGMFELNFQDERYLPFEGAGAISKWRVELPKDFRQFDYNTISDVIIHLKYTSSEGGEQLKKFASDALKDYLKSVEELNQEEGILSVVDLKHDLPNEWYDAITKPVEEGATERLFDLSNINSFSPYFVRYKEGRPREDKDIKVTDVQLILETTLKETDITLLEDDNPINFSRGGSIGESLIFTISGESLSLDKWKLKFAKPDEEVHSGWLISRMTVK